jgi:hypothetical protein
MSCVNGSPAQFENILLDEEFERGHSHLRAHA